MSKNIAAQLKNIGENSSLDITALLQVWGLLQGADIDAVRKDFELIKQGKVLVVNVISSIALAQEQQEAIQAKLAKNFADKELAFVYKIDPAIKHGIQIWVGDNRIEFSVNSKLVSAV